MAQILIATSIIVASIAIGDSKTQETLYFMFGSAFLAQAICFVIVGLMRRNETFGPAQCAFFFVIYLLKSAFAFACAHTNCSSNFFYEPNCTSPEVISAFSAAYYVLTESLLVAVLIYWERKYPVDSRSN
jgi:hypothetical protein